MNDSTPPSPQNDDPSQPANEDPNEAEVSSADASFWSESQVQEVIRHAGSAGLSPEEFFNKKWKDTLIHKKGSDDKKKS